MSAAEIVNKVWNYAHVLRALQNHLRCFIQHFLNYVLVTLQNCFAFHQVFPTLHLESLRASLSTSGTCTRKFWSRSGHDGVGNGDYVEFVL
jgi:hypothetical protein